MAQATPVSEGLGARLCLEEMVLHWRVVPHLHQGVPELEANVDGPGAGLFGLREAVERRLCLVVPCRSFAESRTSERLGPGPVQILCCPVPQLAPERMVP